MSKTFIYVATSIVLTLLISLSSQQLQNFHSHKSEPGTIIAVGDMACGRDRDDYPDNWCLYDHVSDLVLAQQPDAFLALGDLQNLDGNFQDFLDFYHPSYGRLNDISYPVPGNHDYGEFNKILDPYKLGYFRYFKDKGVYAGRPDQGYYAFNLGPWRVYALNTNCEEIHDCDPSSNQLQWFTRDLRNHPALCQLMFMHHPYVNSGYTEDSDFVKPFWEVFYEAGGDVVLSGDTHFYERFNLLDPEKNVDEVSGIRQFIVGTGGHNLHNLYHPTQGCPAAYGFLECASQAIAGSYGALKLTLQPDHYNWEFLSLPGFEFEDTGTEQCHG